VPGLNLRNLNLPTSLSGTGPLQDFNPYELENIALKEKLSLFKEKIRRLKESYKFAFNDLKSHIAELVNVCTSTLNLIYCYRTIPSLKMS